MPLVVAGERLCEGARSHLMRRGVLWSKPKERRSARTTGNLRSGDFRIWPMPLKKGAAQPLGIDGIMITVAMKVMHDPMAPSIPSFLFQKPANKRAPKVHSATPKNQVAPRTPKTG